MGELYNGYTIIAGLSAFIKQHCVRHHTRVHHLSFQIQDETDLRQNAYIQSRERPQVCVCALQSQTIGIDAMDQATQDGVATIQQVFQKHVGSKRQIIHKSCHELKLIQHIPCNVAFEVRMDISWPL